VTAAHAAIIFVAGLAAGTINTIVGSGSLITFPTLLALGYPPVLANVSNNIGLVPGGASGAYGYRRELAGQGPRLQRLVPASLAGGIIGAVLLLVLPGSVFKRVVIVLIPARISPGLVAAVFATGIYGGYFGAAQGIILIALLAIFVADDLQRLNGAKNVLAVCVNGVAAIVFVLATRVDWNVAALIAAGSVIGGQVGARLGRRLDPRALRAAIVAVGLGAIARLV